MDRLQITIHDAVTGKTIVRDMTDEEIAQIPESTIIAAPVEDGAVSDDAG